MKQKKVVFFGLIACMFFLLFPWVRSNLPSHTYGRAWQFVAVDLFPALYSALLQRYALCLVPIWERHIAGTTHTVVGFL